MLNLVFSSTIKSRTYYKPRFAIRGIEMKMRYVLMSLHFQHRQCGTDSTARLCVTKMTMLKTHPSEQKAVGTRLKLK